MTNTPIKFLYSYNGKIMPRQTDGKLRYIGGHTRVLSVPRCVTYTDLIFKFFEACGFSVSVKCKLPNEDLDVLVSITNHEDLRDIVEEYDRVCPGAKIRVVLFGAESLKTISPVSSNGSLVDYAMKRNARVGWLQRAVVRVKGYEFYGFRVVDVPLACS